MHIENPEFSTYGDVGGAKCGTDGAYIFDGAAGSSGLSLRFPEGWDGFDRVVFSMEAENFRLVDGTMALIVNDGYCAWGPPIAKGPYPWINQGANTLTYPTSAFTSGAVSFQLNETFGHSTNWKVRMTAVKFQMIEKKSILIDKPCFSIHGSTPNKTRGEDGSYAFVASSTLLSFDFPQGWKDFENVSFFIGDVKNQVDGTTMSLIVKDGPLSWTDIDSSHGDRYPNLLPGNNILTYPTFLFNNGASLQLNKYGHSTNWTMRMTKIMFHDGPVNDVDLG